MNGFRRKLRIIPQECLHNILVFTFQNRAGAVKQHAAGFDVVRLLP